MEASWTSETSSYHNTTRGHNSEDLCLSLHHREKLKNCACCLVAEFNGGKIYVFKVASWRRRKNLRLCFQRNLSIPIKWNSCHHGLVSPLVAVGRDSLNI
jgi:hypothetical protein